MAEYYAVLSKAVAGLENNGADTRRAVYDKARNALIGQLKAIEPPLPTAEISRQRLELEEAIRRVEREAAAAPKAVMQPRTPPAARSAGASRTQPEQRAKQSPQDVFRRAIQEAENSDDVRAAPARAPVAARADDWSIDEQDDVPAERAVPAAAPQPSARSARVERALPAARKAETYLPSQGYVEEKPAPDEPRLAPDYDYEWDPDSAPRPAASVPARQTAPDVDPSDRYAPRRQRPRGRQREDADNDVDAMERRARPSSLPTILLVVLILVMLAGLGALAWYERAVIADLIGGFDSHQASASKPIAPVTDAASKDGDSLLGNGQAPDSTAAAAPDNDVRVVTPGVDNSAAPAAPAPTTLSAAPVAPDSTAAPAGALVAQKATLYEEPLDPSAAQNGVVAINAAVTWSAAQESDGPEIVGNIDIPDRGMKIKLTFRTNRDKTLPASHVVEVQVSAPQNFPGKGIRDVPRVVMKPAEDVRGQPLVGASAKVADGYFWIGLSGVDADVAANLGLLKQREWFDLPLVYETGQRAIVTFEKGTTGDRVFDQVISAWAAGG